MLTTWQTYDMRGSLGVQYRGATRGRELESSSKFYGTSTSSLREIIDDYMNGNLFQESVSSTEKKKLASLRSRIISRKALMIWRAYAVSRRPIVLTEEEKTTIRTARKWREKVESQLTKWYLYPLYCRLRRGRPGGGPAVRTPMLT